METPANHTFILLRPVMETQVQLVQKQPELPGGSCSCCFHDVCTLCIVAFIPCRGKKKKRNNSLNSLSAPTASISSHFHSQSVLNVSHPPSLSLGVFAFTVSGLDNSNVFAALAQQRLTLFPNSEIVPCLCVLLHTGGDAVGGWGASL